MVFTIGFWLRLDLLVVAVTGDIYSKQGTCQNVKTSWPPFENPSLKTFMCEATISYIKLPPTMHDGVADKRQKLGRSPLDGRFLCKLRG